MIQFIKRLLEKWSCLHKWDLYNRSKIYEAYIEKPVKIEDTLICKICGKIKKIKV